MRVTGLLLITLSLAALAHAQFYAKKDYHLQCSREEMGIRWPSYKSNSEYYVCHRLGDRPMIVNCNSGEVFTFVLQVCTSPSRYIPAPNLNILPTSVPVAAIPWKGHGAYNPSGITNEVQPPLLGAPNVGEIPHPPMGVGEIPHPPMGVGEIPHPPMGVGEIPHPPMGVVDHSKPPTVIVTDPIQEVVQEHKPPHHPAKPHKPVAKPPMPPTPAPTPPVVGNADAPKKLLGKKPTAQKKTPSKKTPSKPAKGSKKTITTTINAKDGKKSPKKALKKPITPAKKAPKAPKASTKS